MTKKQFREYSEIGQWGIATICGDKTDEIVNAKEKYDGNIQVEIKINGVEVDFEEIMNSFNNQFENAVKKEAKDYVSKAVKDKVADIVEILYNIENQADCLQQDLELVVGF